MNELTKEEIEAILTVFSNMNLQTGSDDFLEQAQIIHSIKEKMKAQIEAEKV